MVPTLRPHRGIGKWYEMLVEFVLRFPFEKGLAEGRWSRDWRFGSSTIDAVRREWL
jgi:hypothetical protein